MKLRQERPQRVRSEDRIPVGQRITEATVGLKESGVHIRWQLLDNDEQADLVSLVQTATADGGGLDVDGRLDKKQRARLEKLIERGGDCPGLFQAHREETKFRADVAALAKRALRPDRRPLYQEEGAVTIPRLAFQWLTRTPPAMTLTEVALLYFLTAQLENAEPVSPQSSIEGTGDETTLILSRQHGLGRKFDPHGHMIRWQRELKRLHANSWLLVESHGNEVRVQRGTRMLKAMQGRQA